MVITIDGPTASGKSTAARELAHQLGMYYLNTGMLYRALAYVLMNKKGYELEQLQNPKKDDVLSCLQPTDFIYQYDPLTRRETVTYKGQDITTYLKDPSIDTAASMLGTSVVVRKALLEIQRQYALKYDVVVEGRDCGTVVFPDATVKFYLTASLEIRAQRWQHAQQQRGNKISLEEAKKLIQERDARDEQRAIAPLQVPDDANMIDNGLLDVHATVDQMKQYIKKYLP